MLRIGQVEPSATADGKYTDGSVAGGIAATRLRAAAFNAMQEELANIVESAGMILSPDNMTQVLTALKKQLLSRANPFADIKADGPAAVAAALSNLQLTNADGSVGRLVSIQYIASSKNYTPSSPLVKKVKALVQGAGGAGGGTAATSSTQSAAASGGSGGTYGETDFIPVTAATSIPVTVGAGGIGALGAAGGNGGNTSFGSYINAPGGNGSVIGILAVSAAVGADNSPGAACSGSSIVLSQVGGFGAGWEILGIATSGGNSLVKGGAGGSSKLGSGAPSSGGLGGGGSGVSATTYGAGGSGGCLGVSSGASISGGNGYQGICIVMEYA